ncbi:MAG: Hint domain-containing homing endonuclease [Bacilli bacterium]
MEKNKLCPECAKQGHDSTSSHLFLMSDGRRWCCTHRDYHESGEVYYEDAEGNKIDGSKDNSISNLLATLGMKDSPAKEIPEEMFTCVPQVSTGKREDIREEYRGILPDTFKYYGTQGEYSSSGDLTATVDAVYEADTNKHLVDKMRKLPKAIFTTSKLPDKAKVQFFGQQVAKSSKKLLITEGEYDALSAYQMFQASKYCKGVQVISLPFGANVKAFVDNPKFLKMYKEIYVAVDQDDAGKRVSREIASILPHAKFLFFSEKDANKMLTENKADEFINALFSAEVYRPDTIVTVSDVIDKVMEKPVMGDPWPWPTLTAKTYGRNPGQGIYVGAGVKIGKCFQKGTEVRMYDGSLKMIQDIKVGDKVLTPTGISEVSEVHSGIDQMYKVTQRKAMDYTVNSQHLLCLQKTGTGRKRTVKASEVTGGMGDWKGYRSLAEYPETVQRIPPYILGVWLGDGTSASSSLTSMDEEIITEWKKYAESIDCAMTRVSRWSSGKADWLYIAGGVKARQTVTNPFHKLLDSYNLRNNKHIPASYLYCNSHQRKELLAGLIDTDGSMDNFGGYEITQVREVLAYQIVELIQSLGGRVSLKEKVINNKIYYRVVFYGIRLSCRLERKVYTKDWKRNPRTTGVSVSPVGVGNFYGFTLRGEEHTFFLKDYTVVHNSEFINEVVSFDISRGKKIAVLKYEEPPFITVKRIAGKQDGIFYHKPGVVYKDADLMATAKAMEPFLLMYPAFGQANWESTKDFIRYAALTGCETIIIDPVTKLTNGLDPSQTETLLRTMSDELACMAQDLGFFYIVTCHLKTPSNGPPHERGGKVQSSQYRGSRSMMENTFYMLGIERNKDPELSEEEQNTSTFVLLEDRNFGNSISFPVYYNKIDQSYREPVVNTNF